MRAKRCMKAEILHGPPQGYFSTPSAALSDCAKRRVREMDVTVFPDTAREIEGMFLEIRQDARNAFKLLEVGK